MLIAVQVSAEEPKLAYVDLDGKFNHKLADKFGTEEGNLLTMPKGEQTFEKVKFKVGDSVVQLGRPQNGLLPSPAFVSAVCGMRYATLFTTQDNVSRFQQTCCLLDSYQSETLSSSMQAQEVLQTTRNSDAACS